MSHASKIPSTEAAARALVEAGALSTDISKRYFSVNDAGAEEVILTTGADGEVKVHATATTMARRSSARPAVARDRLKLARVSDLAEFTKRFKQPGTVIFAVSPTFFAVSPTSGLGSIGFTAVIDYSEDSKTLGWNRHRAFVACDRSADVSVWNQQVGQMQFADLIDDWADRVVPLGDATAASLLTMASDLEIEENKVTKVTRDPKTRLFSATLKEGATAKTTIYPRFKVRLPLIEGRPEREVEVRLKLVKSGSAFVFELAIHDLDRLISAEFTQMVEELEKDAGVPVWQGAPPAEMEVGI